MRSSVETSGPVDDREEKDRNIKMEKRDEKRSTSESFRLCVGVLLLLIASVLTFHLVRTLNLIHQYQNDLAEISNIKYELLNADVWADKISAILYKKIDEFELTPQDKMKMRQSMEDIIDQAIVKIDQIIRERNRRGKGFLEKASDALKQVATDILIDFKSLRNRVPEFTDILFEELGKPGTKEEMKQFLRQKIDAFSDSTFSKTDMTHFDSIMEKYGCSEKERCRDLLTGCINSKEKDTQKYLIGIFSLFVAAFTVLLISKEDLNPYRFWILFLSCAVLLVGGISTPMIQLNAEIAELSFELLGEPVLFEHQVLFHQSKSITDVVEVLVESGQFRMVVVGILISAFSVAFPLAKGFASLLFFYNIRGMRKNGVIRFFALRSGKWSMADVMVVALFMAYIGLSGIITSRLSELERSSRYVEILTNNGTDLQAGFYLFLGFCIAGLVFSSALENEMSPGRPYLSHSGRDELKQEI